MGASSAATFRHLVPHPAGCKLYYATAKRVILRLPGSLSLSTRAVVMLMKLIMRCIISALAVMTF